MGHDIDITVIVGGEHRPGIETDKEQSQQPGLYVQRLPAETIPPERPDPGLWHQVGRQAYHAHDNAREAQRGQRLRRADQCRKRIAYTHREGDEHHDPDIPDPAIQQHFECRGEGHIKDHVADEMKPVAMRQRRGDHL